MQVTDISDSYLSVNMCRLFPASCRVCLTENISPPYIYTLEDEAVSEAIGNILQLQTRLYDASLYPHHICEQCKNIIEPFIRLKDLALTHEKFLLKYQEKIKEFGIKETQTYSRKNTQGEENSDGGNYEHCLSSLDFNFETESYLNRNSQNSSVITLPKNQKFVLNTNVDEVNTDGNDNSEDVQEEGEVHCHICGPSRILKKSSLPNHLKTFHKEKDINCEIPGCDKKFKKQSDMKKHVRNIHMGERSHCVQCGDYFKDLHYHMKVFHEHISFPCEMCSKKYTTKQGLNFHIKHTHGDSKKEVCDYCAVEVKHVKHHIKMMHSGVVEKKVSCQEEGCAKMFRTKQEASIHYNAAHLNKKEMCPLCGGWYKNLYTHIHQTHQSEKKHVCDQVCTRSSVFLHL